MAIVDKTMADKFIGEMDRLVATVPGEAGRSLAQGHWRGITTKPPMASERSLLRRSWDWSTVRWYVGTSAVAIAGVIIYRFTPMWVGWFPSWIVKYAGLASALGSYGVMGTQIMLWLTGTEEGRILVQVAGDARNLVKNVLDQFSSPEAAYGSFKNYLSSKGINPTSLVAQELINAVLDCLYKRHKRTALDIVEVVLTRLFSRPEFRDQFVMAFGATATSVGIGVALCWAELNWILTRLVGYWNSWMTRLPSGINFVVNNFPPRPIKLR